EDTEGSPRYMIAVIRGVSVGPSPRWLTDRLASIGQRSINNVVDATNYILFEINQPLHAFDLAKLNGPAVVVRRAKPGEKIVTLDGLTRTLTPDMTAICDAKRPTIIAGVMGSADSEVSPSSSRRRPSFSAPSASRTCSACPSSRARSSGGSPPWRSLWPRRTAASRYRCRGGAPM